MYEDAQYVEAGKGLPKVGKQVQTPDGIGRVDDLDILSRKVRVSFLDRPPATFDASEVRLLDAKPTATPAAGPREDLEIEDATKEAGSSTPPPAAENAEESGEDTEQPDGDSQSGRVDSSAPNPAAENTEGSGEDTESES
jgi:hypothetical protein